MIETNCMTSRPRRAPASVAALTASALLLCTFPAAAALSGAIGAGGAGHSLKETLAETADNFSEMVSAFIDGDEDRAAELMGEVAKTPGKLIKRAFPVLEAPQAIADRLTAARQKVERFAGGVRQGLVDARAALAMDGDDTSAGWRDAALLEGEPLQATTNTAFAAPSLKPVPTPSVTLTGTTGQGSATTNPAASWDFEQWVAAKQQANPHCYGVVDPETLPPECFGATSPESPADKVADTPRAAADDWASGHWTGEGDGWAGWDEADSRYSEADREAARVGVYAANCWGVYEVSRSHGLYELMQTRMQRNECPNEEINQISSDDAGSEYADALADVLEDNTATPADRDYLSALSDLEAKEAERLRLEEEARQRQAQLEAEERERLARQKEEEERQRQARLAQQREFNRQAAQQLGQALGDLVRTYSGGGTSGAATGGGGTSGGWTSPKRYKECWHGTVGINESCEPRSQRPTCHSSRGTCGQR